MHAAGRSAVRQLVPSRARVLCRRAGRSGKRLFDGEGATARAATRALLRSSFNVPCRLVESLPLGVISAESVGLFDVAQEQPASVPKPGPE